MFEQVLDPRQLLLFERVGGLFPGLGALEGDPLRDQDLPQPFPADPHLAAFARRQVVGEFADRPVGERQPQLGRSGGGRLDDQRAVSRRDQAGPATRPARVQRLHPQVVEPVDHLSDPVRRGLHQPGDRGHVVTARRRQHHHRSSPLHDRAVGLAAAPHDALKLVALRVAEATHTHRFAHPPRKTHPLTRVVDASHQPLWSEH